jgi:2'-5' RNA ligase
MRKILTTKNTKYTNGEEGPSTMDAVRSFVAIELPRSIQQPLEAIIGKLKAPCAQAVRWVPVGNIHLTLKFLGDVSPTSLEQLKQLLKTAVSRQPAFTFGVGGLGAFPSLKHPRVIWVGIAAPTQLTDLARLVDSETQKLGYASEERSFSPHLTLGRVSQNATPDQVQRVAEALARLSVGSLGSAEVREVVLFKSDLHPSGSVYSPLLKVSLAASRD